MPAKSRGQSGQRTPPSPTSAKRAEKSGPAAPSSTPLEMSNLSKPFTLAVPITQAFASPTAARSTSRGIPSTASAFQREFSAGKSLNSPGTSDLEEISSLTSRMKEQTEMIHRTLSAGTSAGTLNRADGPLVRCQMQLIATLTDMHNELNMLGNIVTKLIGSGEGDKLPDYPSGPHPSPSSHLDALQTATDLSSQALQILRSLTNRLGSAL